MSFPAAARVARLAAAVLALLQAAPQARAEGASQPPWDLAVLSERIGKLHAQAGQGVLADRARRALTESSRQFEPLLRSATAAAETQEARESYLLLGLLWREYRPWIGRPASRDSARRVAERTEELAWVALKAARAAPQRNGTARMLADASQAGLLAQRVARLHLLRRWDLRDDVSSRELAAAGVRLRAALERLKEGAGGADEIVAELQVAENQLVFLERATQELAAKPAAPRPLEVVAKTADHILESMQRVARLQASAASALR